MALRAEGRKIFHFQTPGLFQIVVVRHNVRTFLRRHQRRMTKEARKNQGWKK
jgi:ABC-type transporter Mla maintaining outer membrane lipid asymmetry ATPase subunit MlaF